jgi:hypothetical protein
MFSRWFFKYLKEAKKALYVREHGILLGTRNRHTRKVYLYMIKDFFVEVLYKEDDINKDPERMDTFSNLDHLNTYLEKEFKAAF